MNILLCICCAHAFADARSPESSQPLNKRIISLSPHLTELVFLLGEGEHLVAVSDFSDFPAAALKLPRVASYQGAKLAEIIRLQPSHVLVWKGGNKDADIAKLEAAGLSIYYSEITDVDSLLVDIAGIAKYLDAQKKGKETLVKLQQKLDILKTMHQQRRHHLSTLYYLSDVPFIALGNDPWLNSLLSLCDIDNEFSDSIAPYPQLSMEQVFRRQTKWVIAANDKQHKDNERFWQTQAGFVPPHLVSANPDKLHRFTDRALDEMLRICSMTLQSQALHP